MEKQYCIAVEYTWLINASSQEEAEAKAEEYAQMMKNDYSEMPDGINKAITIESVGAVPFTRIS
jgi:hypothetical protein